MSLPWMSGGSKHNYQLHDRKTWPHRLYSGTYWSLVEAIKWAIDKNIRYISEDAKLIWENPYHGKGRKHGIS